MDALLLAGRADPDITAKMEPTLLPYVLSIWSKHFKDPLISEAIKVCEGMIFLNGFHISIDRYYSSDNIGSTFQRKQPNVNFYGVENVHFLSFTTPEKF